jgi:hypothetical protein
MNTVTLYKNIGIVDVDNDTGAGVNNLLSLPLPMLDYNANKLSKPELIKLESNKPESNKPELIKLESNKPESNKPESNKSGSNKPESNKSESNKSESNKPESNKPESNKLTYIDSIIEIQPQPNIADTINYNNYNDNFFKRLKTILDTTDLNNSQKILFNSRYINKLSSFGKYKNIYSIAFYINRFLSTTLSVAIPGLLAIQYYYKSNSGTVDNPIYWTAWILSMVGGFITGYNSIFKVDQRYFLLRAIYQKMKNEGWSFIILSKKYDKINKITNKKHTHTELFKKFMESVECIIDDYMKHDMETVMEDNQKQTKDDFRKALNEVITSNKILPSNNSNIQNITDVKTDSNNNINENNSDTHLTKQIKKKNFNIKNSNYGIGNDSTSDFSFIFDSPNNNKSNNQNNNESNNQNNNESNNQNNNESNNQNNNESNNQNNKGFNSYDEKINKIKELVEYENNKKSPNIEFIEYLINQLDKINSTKINNSLDLNGNNISDRVIYTNTQNYGEM